MSDIQQSDVSPIMKEIREKNPILHDELLRELRTINTNIQSLPPEHQKAAVKTLFDSIADRLTDKDDLRQRFLKTFKMDTGFQSWNVDDEHMDEDIQQVLEADAQNHQLAHRTAITAVNPHEIVISQDGSVRNVDRIFGREMENAGRSTPAKTVRNTGKIEKTGKKGGKRRKTNNKKRSKQKRTWRKYFGL
jgi:hypothetical protein